MLHTVPKFSIPGGDHAADHVVLLDEWGTARGTIAKRDAHHASTPLHLAFSCYVVDAAGRVLLTRPRGDEEDLAIGVDQRVLRPSPCRRVAP